MKLRLLKYICPFLLTACLSGNANDKKENISSSVITCFTPGEVWKDTEGNPINAHRGGILYHEGTYYWYGEYKTGAPTLSPNQDRECSHTKVTGVSCYSSKDLMNWKFENIVLKTFENDIKHDLHTTNVLERPQIIYNEKTKKFVMWVYIDSPDHAKACVGVAVSDSPTDSFDYMGNFQPNNAMSHDHTLFIDDNGQAYHFYSSKHNQTMYISRLTDDYLRPSGQYTGNFISLGREAPAVFKYNHKYYLLSSGYTTGNPNQAEIAVADSIMGTWKTLGNPCIGPDADKTFYSQSTFVIPVHGKENTFIAMFDRWVKTDRRNSSYVWLPVIFDDGLPTIPWYDNWDMTVFLK